MVRLDQRPPADRSARLKVRVQQYFATSAVAETGYVGRLRDLTPGRPAAERDSVSGLVVPVGGGFLGLAVRPGRYLIEVVTPGGAVLDADVEVSDGGDAEIELSDDSPSPHEWLGWQQVSGNLPRYEAGPVVPQTMPRGDRRRLWILAGVAVVVLALGSLALATMMIGSGGGSPAPDLRPSLQEVAPPPAPTAPPGATPPADVGIRKSGRGPASIEAAQDPAASREPPAAAALPDQEAGPIDGYPPPMAQSAPEAGVIDRLEQSPLMQALTAAVAAVLGAMALGHRWLFTRLSSLRGRTGARRARLPAGAAARSASVRAPAATTAGAPASEAVPDSPPMPTAEAIPQEAAAAPGSLLRLQTLPVGPGEWDALIAGLADARSLESAITPGLQRAPLSADQSDGRWRTFVIHAAPQSERPLWAIVDKGEGQAEAVRLPERWSLPMTGDLAEIEVMAPVEGTARLSTAVRDPQFGTLLGYLASGRLPEAQAILDHATSALFEKVENPYLAAAGGYVLTGSADSYEDAHWRRWIENLDMWFPWLPDGAILQALNLVQTRRPGARDKTLEAVNRGAPVYTEGLKRLRDLLMLAASEPDPDGAVAEATERVDRLASRCNPQQVFTSIRLGK